MTRQQYADLAGRIAQCFVALEDKPEQLAGAVQLVLMISEVIEQDGKMGKTTFLRRCGITPGKKHGRRLQLDAMEALLRWTDRGWDEGEVQPLRPAQLSA